MLIPNCVAPDPEGLNEPARSRVMSLALGLQRSQIRQTLRYVGYGQAERDCERLAAMLGELCSARELAGFAYAAIPRGGLIVLGMLSYMLGLDAAQLQPDSDPSRPLVVVDDCAMTGRRLVEFASRATGSHLVFAHLYSHPDLRQKLLEHEPRLRHCVAAHDLVDHAPERYPDAAAYVSWQETWQARSGPGELWHGQPDLICFAWSEPERVLWNPVSGRVESGWRFLPPHVCLKNRALLNLPPVAASVRDWQVPRSVVSSLYDGVLWLCESDSQQVYSLSGVSVDMWRALAGYGDLDVAIEYLVGEYDIDTETLRGDLVAFAERLRDRGLLERVDGGGPSGTSRG